MPDTPHRLETTSACFRWRRGSQSGSLGSRGSAIWCSMRARPQFHASRQTSSIRSVEPNATEACPGGAPDERTSDIGESLDPPPLAHDDLELLPGVACILARQSNHLRALVTHRRYLSSMVLDSA